MSTREKLLLLGADAVLVLFAITLAVASERPTKGAARVGPAISVGATAVGEMVARDLGGAPARRWTRVGFADEDRSRRGLRIRGAPVLGGREDLPDILKRYPVDE